MKKITIVVYAFIAVLMFIGASVWEGSGAVSSRGELPEGAYYAATNSFPRNTVVDVTNLENGRTIRVIVAAGLDSPGLLAMLSRNAATAIGISSPNIGRIRMTQPSDPVAYSRFTEERELAGGSEAEAATGTAGNTPLVVSSSVRTATAEDLAASTPEDRFFNDTINRSEAYIPPPATYPTDGSVYVEPRPNWLPEEDADPPGIAEAPSPGTAPALVPETPLVAVPAPEPGSPAPVLVAPAPEAVSVTQTPEPGVPHTPSALPPPPPPPVISLVPAEERPPLGAAVIPPESEIGPIRPLGAPAPDDTYLDPRYFIGPIPSFPAPYPQTAPHTIPAAALSAPQAVPARPAPLPSGSMFSVPVISQLEWGKYYVQVGAFTRPDTLEGAVTRIDRSYPLMIQSGGPQDVYRLLIGPLNMGESGAVLKKIKTTGYPDAFVRNGS
jgi:hypothetical protein